MPTLNELLANNSNAILYDGECPVCANYVSFLRFKEELGEVALIDCRADEHFVVEACELGYDLNDGMILILQGQLFYGDKAVQKIAHSSAPKGMLNRLQSYLLRTDFAAKSLYPLMVIGRKALLKLLGRSVIQPNPDQQ